MARQDGDLPIIHRRKDGRFYARVELPSTTGKRQRKDVYGTTRREVQTKCRKLLADMAQGQNPLAPRHTLGQFLELWLLQVVKVKNSPRTYLSYAAIVEQHITPHIGYIHLADLSPDHILLLQSELRKKQYCNKPLGRTVPYACEVLRHALGVAVKWGLVTRNVAELVDMPRDNRREKQSMTPDQARAFLAVVEQSPHALLYRVAITFGMRRGEILGLQWGQIDMVRKTISINASLQRYAGELHRTDTKTRASVRTLPLPSYLLECFAAHKAACASTDPTAYVFTRDGDRPIEPRRLLEHFKRMLEVAGIPDMPFHNLRRSAATFMALQGVAPKTAMRILGHSRIATTLEVYTSVLPEMEMEALEKIENLF